MLLNAGALDGDSRAPKNSLAAALLPNLNQIQGQPRLGTTNVQKPYLRHLAALLSIVFLCLSHLACDFLWASQYFLLVPLSAVMHRLMLDDHYSSSL